MRKKRIILVLILLMAVGFATIATSIFINGSTIISVNQSDFKVLFTKTVLDDVKDNSLIVDDTHIVFTTNELKNIGDKSILVYTIKNNSRNYDALLNMTFSPESTEYIKVTNTLEKNTLESDETTTGTLTVELIKGYVGENALEQSITVEINASAVEKNTLGEITTGIKVSAKDTHGQDILASSETIVGEKRDEIVEQLIQSNVSGYVSEDDKLLEITTGNLNNISTLQFNVSEIADDGERVIILSCDHDTDTWTYVGQDTIENGIIECDLSTNAPVVFAVKQNNGEYQITTFKNYVIKSGDLDTFGSIVSIGDDDFIVIGNDDDNNVKLLLTTFLGDQPIAFSTRAYWYDESTHKKLSKYSDKYVYDENSLLYEPVNNYLKSLRAIDSNILSARLLSYGEYNSIRDNDGITLTKKMWLGSFDANGYVYIYSPNNYDKYSKTVYSDATAYIRPVIILKR